MTLMLGRIVNDRFVPLTVTDTAGGRKLEQVGWVKRNDFRISVPHYPEYGPEQVAWHRKRGYVPTYREVE